MNWKISLKGWVDNNISESDLNTVKILQLLSREVYRIMSSKLNDKLIMSIVFVGNSKNHIIFGIERYHFL